jgi:hypothetical protein
VGLVSEDEEDGEEVEALEPPSAPVIVLVSEDKEVVASPMTPFF